MSRLPALRLWVLLLAMLSLAACVQPVPMDQRDFIGHWRGDGVLLVIQADGHASYAKVDGRRRTNINGPAHSFSTTGFKIGIGPLSAHFKLQSPPTQADGVWRMTMDGAVLTRVDVASQLQKSQPTIDL